MKYILMMQFALAEWRTEMIDKWPAHDIQVHMEHLREFREEFIASGEMVVTHGLVGPDDARFVRARQGEAPEVTDGPFPETKEFLGRLRDGRRRYDRASLLHRLALVGRPGPRRQAAEPPGRGATRDVAQR